MDLQNRKVLVTGGAGFVGSHLVDALIDKGARVIVVDNLVTGVRENVNPRAIFCQTDFNDDVLENVLLKDRPEIIYSLAFNTIVQKSIQNPLLDVQEIAGTVKSLMLASKYKAKKFIFASSAFVYGNTRMIPTKEEESILPVNPYAISKFSCENYVNFFRNSYGLDGIVLRFSAIYGPRQVHGPIADYIRSVLSGKDAEMYGDGEKTRDYIYISDAVNAYLKVLDFDIAGMSGVDPVFNIGSNTETSLNDMFFTIADIVGKRGVSPVYKPGKTGEIERSCVNIEKAKKYLGWEPTIRLREGLEKTVGYYAKQLINKD